MKWLIKKGKHFVSNFYYWIHFGEVELMQKVSFDKSCLYTPFDSENDTNKGCGFTYGLGNDDESIRWGWRPTVDAKFIEVCCYVHEKGVVRRSPYIRVVPNTPCRIRIKYLLRLSAVIEVWQLGDYKYEMIEGVNLNVRPGYLNRPYFGGDNPAPHDVIIHTKTL